MSLGDVVLCAEPLAVTIEEDLMRSNQLALAVVAVACVVFATPLIGLNGPDRLTAFVTETPLLDAVIVEYPFDFVVAALRVAQSAAEDDDGSSEDSTSDDASSDDASSDDSASEDSSSDDPSSDDSDSDSDSEDSTSAEDRFGKRNGPREKLSLKAMIWLAETSNGVNPAAEEMAVQFGEVTVLIPAGSLEKRGHAYRYSARGGREKLKVKLRELAGNGYSLNVKLEGADLSSIDNPVLVSVVLGDDGGESEVEARIRTIQD